MPQFRKSPTNPSAKHREEESRDEPKGLDAFAAGAGNIHLVESKSRKKPKFEMSVRFEDDEKLALEKLAAHEERSQQQIIKRLLRPILLAAAKKVDAS